MAHHHPEDQSFAGTGSELVLGDLYRGIADTRAAVIEGALADVRELPEAPAETFTLAAAALAHVAGLPSATTARASLVARRLIAEARRLDPRAGALAEDWLAELESVEPVPAAELLQESADALAWAAATLRHMARLLEGAEDGNAEQVELAWLCLGEAAELLMAADHMALAERRSGVYEPGGNREGRSGGDGPPGR
jgi:hypothetical protein